MRKKKTRPNDTPRNQRTVQTRRLSLSLATRHRSAELRLEVLHFWSFLAFAEVFGTEIEEAHGEEKQEGELHP